MSSTSTTRNSEYSRKYREKLANRLATDPAELAAWLEHNRARSKENMRRLRAKRSGQVSPHADNPPN